MIGGMSDPRYFPCDSLVNLREIGGLPTQSGGAIKTGRLYRSADLSRLAAGDYALVQQLQLRLVCDLRSAQERQANPSRLPLAWGVGTVWIPFDAQLQGMNRQQALHYFMGKTGGEEYAHFVRQMYHAIAFEHTAQVKAVFDLICVEANLPVLIHCTAGKDRTGFLAALIQHLLGAPRQLVIEDYLLTNRYYAPQAARYARRIRWMTLFRAKPERIRQIFAAQPEYLEQVLDEIDRRYGGVSGYLEQGCGVSAPQLQALQTMLVEK